MMEELKKDPPAACPCKRTGCERFGKCDECMEHHRLHKKHPPYCQRPGRKKKDKKL